MPSLGPGSDTAFRTARQSQPAPATKTAKPLASAAAALVGVWALTTLTPSRHRRSLATTRVNRPGQTLETGQASPGAATANHQLDLGSRNPGTAAPPAAPPPARRPHRRGR